MRVLMMGVFLFFGVMACGTAKNNVSSEAKTSQNDLGIKTSLNAPLVQAILVQKYGGFSGFRFSVITLGGSKPPMSHQTFEVTVSHQDTADTMICKLFEFQDKRVESSSRNETYTIMVTKLAADGCNTEIQGAKTYSEYPNGSANRKFRDLNMLDVDVLR